MFDADVAVVNAYMTKCAATTGRRRHEHYTGYAVCSSDRNKERNYVDGPEVDQAKTVTCDLP